MKRPILMRALLALLAGFVVFTTATAQTSSDPNEGSRLTYDHALGSYDFSWWGQPGRTYFLQHSNDLSAWQYLPLIESGADGLLAWRFNSTDSKIFLRLRYSDIPTSDPFNDDFDGDKVSNYDELLFGTDPLVSLDSDLDGLPDDWEKRHFGNLDSSAADDPDNDGLSNLAEFMHGTNPNAPDSDFDGLSDGDEVHIHGTDPLKWDSDGDTLPDGWEVQHGLDPLDPSDAAQTAAGGGMTNLQHYQLGSNPNEPPPPPIIIAGTATLNLNADTQIYPTASSFASPGNGGNLITNGDFSQPPLSDSWKLYDGGIPGWTAISGSLVELQQIWPNAAASAGQYCELDSHWRDGQSESDHGIKQTVDLPRGHYLLIFDYRGREAGADSFTVNAQVGNTSPATLPVELAAKNGAALTWKRAIVSFEVAGGNPNQPTVPVTLLFDIADAGIPDSYGAFIDNVILSPVEVEVSRPDFQKKAWVAGADNLLSVWDTHKKGNDWLDVRVKLPDGMTQSTLPAGFLKWQYDGATETIPDNTVQHRFRWPGQHGIRKISISFGPSGYKKLLFVDLPDVGGVSEHEAEAISLLLPGGLASLTRFWAWKAVARLATDDSLDLGVSKGERNALRHAYWNALASSDPMVGQDMTLMLTTAHEWDAWDAGNQQACESTMDLWNNYQGSTVQHSILLQPNTSAIWSDLLQKLSNGQLWVWNADEESEHSANSKDLTIKSDRKKIFPTEEH